MKKMFIPALVISFIFSWVYAQERRPTKASLRNPQRIVVHLTHYTDDIHAAFMALELADRMQAKGATVTLLLDLQGVRLESVREARASIRGPGTRPFSAIYASFIKHGGRVAVCLHCAKAAGVDQGNLRAGCSIVSAAGLADVILAADKILDY